MVQLQMVASTLTSGLSGYNHKVSSASNHSMESNGSDSGTVCKRALLRKVKTGKHKFFVLHKDSSSAPARLEYYDSESQWTKNKKPKKSIYLRSCFSLNAFSDLSLKTKFGITLYTKDESLKIAFDSEQSRDMWLAEMHLLKHSEKIHSPVQHVWCVRAHTRSMKYTFEGSFKLCLNELQASLISIEDSDHVIELPLNCITECHQNNNFFGMEVSEQAECGPGELWLELEDALIAQHVHRAFTQNMLIASAADKNFRPPSRSLSYKDKKSAYAVARIRTGSDARQSGRVNYSPMSKSHSSFSSAGFQSQLRERSDSIGSQSTTASLSTDDSECSHWQGSSRSTTPESQSHYLAMNITKPEDNCKCLSSSGSLSSDAAQSAADGSYADMTSHHHRFASKPHDTNSNFVYVDMSGTHHLPYLDSQQSKSVSGYLDMSVGQSSPNCLGYTSKLEPVKCYLINDEEEEDNSTAQKRKSEISTNQQQSGRQHPPSHSPLPQPPVDHYVDMCRRKMLTDKSSSAPHLLPTAPYQPFTSDLQSSAAPPEAADIFMNLDFDNRDRTASMSSAHRPRGSSWSQYTRPRASTTDQKRRSSRINRVHNNNLSNNLKSTAEYIDMTCGGSTDSKDSYVEMSLDKQSKERLASAKLSGSGEREDKENHLPTGLTVRTHRVPPLSHPFPELLSASSDDDLSLHSLEGSLSLHSLTSSADSMSTSSHSSQHSSSGGGAFTSSIDHTTDRYISWSPAPSPGTTSHNKTSVPRSHPNPVRVPSYILDDTRRDKITPSSSSHTDYMEMSPPTSRHTKQ